MATVDLVISEAISNPVGGVMAYRIQLQLVNPIGMTDKLFVAQRSIDPGTEDNFLLVAAASDLVNVPELTGDELDGDLYRTDEIEVLVDSLQIGEDFIDSVRRRIDALALSLQELEDFQQTRTITVGSA